MSKTYIIGDDKPKKLPIIKYLDEEQKPPCIFLSYCDRLTKLDCIGCKSYKEDK